jgi:aldehyde:ferredoxin oxidoreductase
MVEAARTFGGDAEYLLSHVKGQPSIEPFRIPKGWALGVSASPVAGRHLRGAVRGPDHSGPPDVDFDITGCSNQARAVVWQAKTKELEDDLGICNYVGTWSGAHFLLPRDYAELACAGLGLDVDEEYLMSHYAVVGRDLERAFNALHTDLSRADDLPPRRFRREPVSTGPYRGAVAGDGQCETMLDEFYELSGWSRDGTPSPERLDQRGFGDVADRLRRRGIA